MKTKGNRAQNKRAAIQASLAANTGEDFGCLYIVEHRPSGRQRLLFEDNRERQNYSGQNEDIFFVGEYCRLVINDFGNVLARGQELMAAA